MLPEWNVVCPMIVASSVVFPTPLRPRTASDPRSGSENAISSSTTVSPYPARTSFRTSASGMALLAEVHLMHALVLAYLLGRAFDQHLALNQHGDAPREAEHEIHVVLDDEDRDLLRQSVQHLEDAMGFERGHARRRLVEEQHARLEAQRDRDLDQALLAVGQVEDALVRVLRKPQGGEELHAFVAHLGVRA